MDDAARKARELRTTALLPVCLAAAAGQTGNIRKACDLAEDAIAAALREAEVRGMTFAANELSPSARPTPPAT